jgi:hypothetical protein
MSRQLEERHKQQLAPLAAKQTSTAGTHIDAMPSSDGWHAAAVAPGHFAARVQWLRDCVLIALPVLVLIVRHQTLWRTATHDTASDTI